jgi:hypothetical protein
MLTILDRPDKTNRFCDGVSRRNFLRIGSLAMGGLTLPQVLRAEAQAGTGRSHKATIMIFLAGGPPHQDMFDLKMQAPAEVRGPFQPIETNVPGIEICELMPRLAQMMDKFVPIRSIVGSKAGHSSFQCFSGRSPRDQPAGGWPSMGGMISKFQGPVNEGIPPYLSLCYKTKHAPWGDPGQAGFLGVGHSPFRLIGGETGDMVLKGITLDRLGDRKTLLTSFDRFRRDTDANGLMDGLDAFTRQALGVLTSSTLADALDLSKEDPRLVARYGKGNPKDTSDGPPKMMENFLIARRLVEAGARVVTLNFSRWDWHGGNFKRARTDLPMLDQGVTALVEDLHERGLDQDVNVVVWGEFGRTPKINKNAGRDHWPQVSCALLAGGGMRTGQVIGSTNRLGEHAKDRPVHFGEVLATLYHQMGLDVNSTRMFDLRSRPQYLVDAGITPMPELI